MHLFSAVSSYQLLNIICYRLLHMDDEDCTLMISTWIKDKHPKYEKLTRYFNKIVVCDQAKGLPTDAKKPVDFEYLEHILKTNGIELNKCSSINIAGAHFLLGIYCCEKKIPFTYWEEASGLLSRPEVLMDTTSGTPAHQEIIGRYGLFSGQNPSITKRICNKNAQISELSDDNLEHFDVVSALMELPNDEREFIRDFYTDVEKIDIPEDSVLILTQHFANLQQLSFEDQALIYQVFVDYFFPDRNLVIKPHPDDIMYYGLLFPKARIIREKFPSEFIPFMFTHTPDVIATISSTAVYNLRGYFDKIFSMDFKFQKDFHVIHRYYTALRLAVKIVGADCVFEKIGTDDMLFENMHSIQELKNASCCGQLKKLYIVDDISQSSMTRDDVIKLAESLEQDEGIFFINSKEDYCFYDIDHKALWDNILPICIKKSPKRQEEFFADIKEEVIYFCSKQKKVIEMAEKERIQKDLNSTGMEITLEDLTPDQKRIKILEGILKATEERLLYYKNLADKADSKK